MAMRTIDPDTWSRRASYNTFVNNTNPTFSITTRVDVTRLYNRCKKEKTSFFIDFLYIATRCLNEIEEMRTRIKGEDVVVYDAIDPGFVVIKEDESIINGRVKMTDDYYEFYNSVRDTIEYLKANESEDRMNKNQTTDIFYTSCLPWMDFTSVTHPYNYPDRESCSIPRITWGMATEESDRWTMALDIAAHHALIDGYQICKGVMGIQEALNDLRFF